jgi:hypothetical protein
MAKIPSVRVPSARIPRVSAPSSNEPTKAVGFTRTRTSEQARADYMKRRAKATSVLEAGAGPYQTPTIQDYAANSPLSLQSPIMQGLSVLGPPRKPKLPKL